VFEEPPLDADGRRRLRKWLEGQPAELVGRWARRLDPERVASLDVLDPQRAGRAIEVALLSGRGLSWWHRHGEPDARPVPMLVYGLGLPPQLHRERIRRRVERLLDGGWLEEVRALQKAGVPPDAPALGAVGYREIAALLAGELERDAAAAEITRRTWRYARRQRTWLRHQLPGLRWLDATLPIDQLAERVAREWARAVGGTMMERTER
jgi:tRNA dimethylallyltransferase